MLRLPCSKLPSLRLLRAAVSSSLRRPSRPLSFKLPDVSCTRSPINTMASRRQYSSGFSTRLDPNSLMEDTESELFNYTTGRFLYVSYILSRFCLTHNVPSLVPTRLFASESVGASSISLDSSKSSLGQSLAALRRSLDSESSERVATTALSSSPSTAVPNSSRESRIPS